MVHIGDKYNLLTVIRESSKRGSSGIKFWICQCECGNIKEIRGDKLQSGHTKSCGCLNTIKRINDISGNVYGQLTVIEPTEQRATGGDVIWKCKCKCGNYTFATKSELIANRKKSCGCIRSNGELYISTLLTQNDIPYKKEYIFDDLQDNGKLRFDFGILDNNNQLQYLIEYDGEIHFKDGQSWNGHLDYETLHRHDIMKNNYCKQHNIPLIRIPYTIKNNIQLEDILLSTTKYLIENN